MTEFNTGLPSIRQLQGFLKDKQEIEVKLLTNDILVGKLRWQDTNCLCLVDANDQSNLVWWQAVAYIKAKA